MPADPALAWRAASVGGFLLLVGAYIANQRHWTRPESWRYLVANALGSGILALYSGVIGEWVFVALEGFWCLASLLALRGAFGTARGAE